jgi:thioredoxin-related protein
MTISRIVLVGVVPALCSLALSALAAPAKPAPWPTNFEAALSRAKAENKFVLAAFTGSDWCPWCQKLKAEVFDKPPFAVAAGKRFVLINLDFPHEKKLSDALKKQNETVQKRYGCYGYPTVLVLTADGHVVARTGYREGGPQNYLQQLGGFLTTWQAVVDLRKQLPDAGGIDRAKILDQLVQDYHKLNNPIGALAGWRKQIVTLDADNAAGLRQKYEFAVLLSDAQNALDAHKPVVAQQTAEKALALTGLKPLQIQHATALKSNCLMAQKKVQESVDCLEKAIAAAPKSPDAEGLKKTLQQRRKQLEAKKDDGPSGKEVTQDK